MTDRESFQSAAGGGSEAVFPRMVRRAFSAGIEHRNNFKAARLDRAETCLFRSDTLATTTGKTEEMLIDWLRDAHVMEKHAEQMLEKTASRIENYPELRQQIERHLEITRREADLVRGCIERHDTSTSTMKDAGASMAGIGQALTGLFVGDDVVKASMASFAFEEMEIAAYKALIAAAEQAGDSETKQVCETILHEEEDMAEWLNQHLPAITRAYLARAEQGVTAKH